MEQANGFHAMESEPSTRDKIKYLSLNELSELAKAMQEHQAQLTQEYYEVIERRKELWEQGEQL